MEFSCKISHSILCYLERHGCDTSFVYDWPDFPHEFLSDPTYWLEAAKMERFLSQILADESITQSDTSHFLKKIGHSCPELRTWGVLDSVLQIMEDPLDVWQQPEKFLGYFIRPVELIESLEFTKNHLKLKVDLPTQEFPYCVEFLRFAFESLPLYGGKAFSCVNWKDSILEISSGSDQENSDQKNGLIKQSKERNLSPELRRTLVGQLEDSQKEKEELAEIHRNILSSKQPINDLEENIFKLKGYMVRAQEIMTFLLEQSDSKKSSQELVKQMNWDRVQDQFSIIYGDVSRDLVQLQGFLRAPKNLYKKRRKKKTQEEQKDSQQIELSF